MGEERDVIERELEELKKDAAKIHYELGEKYMELKEYAQAEEEFYVALRYDDTNPDIYMQLGRVAFKRRNYKDAVEYWQKANEHSGGANVKAIFNIGIGYMSMGEYDRALEAYAKLLVLNPNDADAYNNMGLAYSNKGEYQKAIENFEKALSIKGEDPDIYYNLANTYYNMEDYISAANYFSKALELAEDDVYILNNLADTFMRLGEYEKALELVSRAVYLRPDYASGWCTRGEILAKMGRKEEALESFKKSYHYLANKDGFLARYLKEQIEELGEDPEKVLSEEMEKMA